MKKTVILTDASPIATVVTDTDSNNVSLEGSFDSGNVTCKMEDSSIAQETSTSADAYFSRIRRHVFELSGSSGSASVTVVVESARRDY